MVNITLNTNIRPRVAQALRRHGYEIEQFDSALSPEVRLTGEVIDGGTDERFLLQINDSLALVVAKDNNESLVVIGTTTFW